MSTKQKIIFFPIAEEGSKIFGVFRVKNHDFTAKNHIFSKAQNDIQFSYIITYIHSLVVQEKIGIICL
jgi:hypothetical protein